LSLKPRRVRYAENGYRAVPVETTLAVIERTCLATDREVQFRMGREWDDRPAHAFLKFLSPAGAGRDERYFGKGTTRAQTVASACLEFFERQCAKPRPDDIILEASYTEIAPTACDPRLFGLPSNPPFRPDEPIDWVWGYSLTRSEAVRVPANLVFLPYEADRESKFIAWNDSNGLAAGNCIEEAILHAILEVIERDAAMIDEYNDLPRDRIAPRGLARGACDILSSLEAQGYACSFKSAMTDMPFPAVSAFLQKTGDPAQCCVAFGCHLDPGLAMSRALTEAVQLMPPSVNQEEWYRSGASARHAAPAPNTIPPGAMQNLASGEILADIRMCAAILKEFGSEVIVVDLSLPDIPFPTVRVLATGLQPLLHDGQRRFNPRFFEVPVKLGLRHEPPAVDVRIWPLCGYK
jgi:YcaO-like protein with predicted kinase domain